MRQFYEHIVHLLGMFLCLIGCINYPKWYNEGYLDDMYMGIFPLWLVVLIPTYVALPFWITYYVTKVLNK